LLSEYVELVVGLGFELEFELEFELVVGMGTMG
jgi:hypothetical protein